MKLIIEIKLDNAAFEDAGYEVSRILTNLSVQAFHAYDRNGISEAFDHCSIHDTNGNKVGFTIINNA